MLMSPMRDGRTTSKDSATQLLICEPLSFVILILTNEGFETAPEVSSPPRLPPNTFLHQLPVF